MESPAAAAQSPNTAPDGGPSISNALPRPRKQRRLRAVGYQRVFGCSCRNCEAYGEECVISRNGAIFHRARHGNANPRAQQRAAQKQGSDGACVAAASVGSSPGLPRTSTPADLTASQAGPSSPVAENAVESEPVQGVVTTEVGQFPKNAKFAGLSSPQVLARVAQEVFSPFSQMNVMDFFCPMMTFAEEFPLPSPSFRPLVAREVADGCVQRYFNTYHHLFPVLDEQALRQTHAALYGPGEVRINVAQVACVFLVIALGASSTEVFNSHLETVFGLYNHLISKPYLPSVQALILMTLCFLHAAKDGQAVLCIAFAAQMAQSVGLHRSLFIYRHPCEIAFVLRDHDLRNRIWWTCYCLDKLAKTLSNISCKLFRRDVRSVDNSELVKRILAADRDLLSWRDSLPENLQPDREPYALGDEVCETGSGMLHCVYYNALVIIHRASLVSTAGKVQVMKKHMDRRISASDDICLGAARSLVRTVNNLVIERRSFRIPGMIHPYAINAVMALYIGIMQAPLRWSAPTDLALMRSMQQCFEKSRDPAAGSRFRGLMVYLTEAMEKSEQAQRNGSQTPSTINHAGTQPAPSWSIAEHSIDTTLTRFSPVNQSPGGHLQPSTSCQPRSTTGSWAVTSEPSQSYPTPSLVPDPWNSGLPVDVEGLQLGDFFGDHSTAWNMQLWPLMEDVDGGGLGEDEAILE
ncbi:unnamed protein product [Clonostachys rhizophaga]|uniref:Xylanolytic transcriptional activator regulatory domain-containing protein n=1 Tax=Clonostachys rhizophaga TaxID=160324 RepID=A0A9N9VN61_9HYPO|nr:unnamed protein product [Clonostachys rhizophaga]